MNDNSESKDVANIQAHSLPLKITGIVFWGLILLGLIASTLLIRSYEQELSQKYAARPYIVVSVIKKFLQTNNNPGPQLLEQELALITKNQDLLGLTLHYDRLSLTTGKTDSKLASSDAEFTVTLNREHGTPIYKQGNVIVYQQPLEDAVATYRKQILIFMGALCFAFGWILQLILRRILTDPFIRMVTTAKNFTLGQSELRFDDSRDDEFGFLSTFINKALDHLHNESRELKDALAREKHAEQELSQEKERAEITLQSIADGVITANRECLIEYLNPVAEKLTGWRTQDAKGVHLSEVLNIIDDNTRQSIKNPVERCLNDGTITGLGNNRSLIRRDKTEIAIEHSAAPIKDRAGNIIGAVIVIQDVGHARALSNQLSYQASHDALTDLYNRVEFETQMSKALQSATYHNKQHALCYLDLDQFKIVNDTCGHIAGDNLLTQLAEVLKFNIRDSDILARLGGDEFGILLKDCHIEHAQQIAETIREAIKDFRFAWEGRLFEIGGSIGLVSINSTSTNLTEVLSAADMACYSAKEKGRNRIHVFEQNDRELQRRRGEMQQVSKVSTALKENRFKLYYQSIIPIQERNIDKTHFEILVRMQDDDDKILTPDCFLRAAERYDLITNIDKWVIDNLFFQLNNQLLLTPRYIEYIDRCMITVNLSGASVCDDNFVTFLQAQIKHYQIPPQIICFEITETAAVSNLRKAHDFIVTFKDLGCKFALDDFGSGMSSFSYLKNLPVDYLKIDGSYVNDIVSDPMDRALVASVNQIGHILGMKTIAEFVENDQILRILAEIGVDYAQGFGISEPKDLVEFLSGVKIKSA